MTKANQQRDISVLFGPKGLVQLTANDWKLLADKASQVEFQAGERILVRGKRTQGIYLLLSGTATVQIPTTSKTPMIGAGEICGEILFLDDLPATANVIAQERVEAFFLDQAILRSLFELFPHLESRFYHSLAKMLSRRLRDVIET